MEVSIHAPRAGRDRNSRRPGTYAHRFNPRAPCGARRRWRFVRSFVMVFQSTHPSRGATVSSIGSIQTLRFQSTHPSRGATCGRRCETGISKRFNPRTPRGVRPCISSPCSMCSTSFNPRTPRGVRRRLSRADTRGHPVSIHAPLAGCDHGSIWRSPPFTVSIHAPLAGCDFVRQAAIHRCRRFNPRTPRGVRPQARQK